jgi:hypothetical protein
MTLYISGLSESVEAHIRYWASKVGRPWHVLASIFEYELHPTPWPIAWLGTDLGNLFVERMRKIYRDSTEERFRAAIIGLIPQDGRTPAIVEMTSRTLFGESLPSLTIAEIRELDTYDTLTKKAKRLLVNVITAPDAEPETKP